MTGGQLSIPCQESVLAEYKGFSTADMDLCFFCFVYFYSNFEQEGEVGAEETIPVTITTTATMIFKRETGKRNGIQSTHPKARSITW